MVKLKALLYIIFISFVVGSIAYAHHPNEGDVTLSTLIEGALKNNIEIKEAEKQFEMSTSSRKQAVSPYFPEVGVEGGYQTSRFENDTSSGSFAYGVAKINLYHGGKDQAQLSIKNEEEDFQKIRLEKTKAHIEREVSRKYYELLYLQESIAVKEEALVENKSQSQMALKKKVAGITSQADVLEFELREATLRSDINFLKQEEATEERELRQITGKVEGPLIRVGGHLNREVFSPSQEALLSAALFEREDLKEAQKNVSFSELEYRSFFGDYLPRVSLEGKYGKLTNEERVFNSKSNFSALLKVSIPLFSGLDTLYARQSKASEIARNDLITTRIKQGIKVQIENALSRLKSIEERLNLEEKNMEHSKQYYEITLSEYKRGVKNSPDLAGASERLFDARFRNLQYRKDFYLTRLELAGAIGVSQQELLKK